MKKSLEKGGQDFRFVNLGLLLILNSFNKCNKIPRDMIYIIRLALMTPERH